MYLYEQLIKDAVADSTLREVGGAIGVPATTIHDWIRLDKRPRLDTLPRIAEWANLPVPALLVDIENNNLAERIILLMQHLSDDQKQQIVNQMEQMIPDDAAVP